MIETSLTCDYLSDDSSQPGHILGSAEGRSTQATSERTLSPSSNILLRLLTHMAMFIGANEHSDVNNKEKWQMDLISNSLQLFFNDVCLNFYYFK